MNPLHFFVSYLNARRQLILLFEFPIDLVVVHWVQLEHAVVLCLLLGLVQGVHKAVLRRISRIEYGDLM